MEFKDEIVESNSFFHKPYNDYSNAVDFCSPPGNAC